MGVGPLQCCLTVGMRDGSQLQIQPGQVGVIAREQGTGPWVENYYSGNIRGDTD